MGSMSAGWRVDELQVAQHVIATVVESVCHGQGNERLFCERAKVSTVFVSNIRNRKQIPTMATARHMLAFMDLPKHEGHKWLDHVASYWNLKHSSERAVIRIYKAITDNVIDEISYIHVRGRYSADSSSSLADLSSVIALAEPIVTEVSPEWNYMSYLRLCSVLHEAYMTSGRIIDALHLSRWMQCVANLGISKSGVSMHRDLEHEAMTALYQEMVTLQELGVFRHAFVLGQRIERLPSFREVRNHWIPMLGWDRLMSLAYLRRSSIRDAERIAKQAVAACEEGGGILLGLCRILVARSLAEVYISHNSFTKAMRLLDHAAELVTTERYVGPLHRIQFLRTLARYYKLTESQSSPALTHTITQALNIAKEAGLHAQSWHFRRLYAQDLSITVDF